MRKQPRLQQATFPQMSADKAYALEISGDSMKPVYRAGDIIIVSPALPVRKGDRVLVKTTEGEMLVKELVRKSRNSLELNSLSPEGRARKLRLSEVEQMARIVWASQ